MPVTSRFVQMRLPALVLLLASVALAGCATTKQSRKVERSGFLGDYSQLQPGEKDQAQLVYIDPAARWSEYEALIIDSVTLWRDAETKDVPAEEAQRLTDYLYVALNGALSADYRIVEQPGPGVLRLRAAITEAKGSKVAMNTITSVIPQLRLLATIGGMATGTTLLVGKAGIEGELTDSLTGERLAAVVDERHGTKAIRGGIKKWSDAKLAFDFWAKRFAVRLAELRGS